MPPMIKVWTDGAEAGLLDRGAGRGSTFTYALDATPPRAVSSTMPVRLKSWTVSSGIAPIFEMNLPEGALRERLRLAFAKATGTFDDLDLLGIVQVACPLADHLGFAVSDAECRPDFATVTATLPESARYRLQGRLEHLEREILRQIEIFGRSDVRTPDGPTPSGFPVRSK